MQEKRKQQLLAFCAGLNVQMHDLELLNMALTHTSFAHEARQNPKPRHNERIVVFRRFGVECYRKYVYV